MQQASKTVPGRFDFLRFSLAHDPMTLRHQRQSYSQLHGWPRGVVPSRLPFSFQGALVFRGFAAVQSLGYASPLCCNSGAGEQVVWPRDVGLWRVAAVQFRVSLQKVLSQ
jgi:hypothetical protein